MKRPSLSRSGSVVVEHVMLVSIVALSVLIFAAMTGFTGKVAAEYSEMGSEISALNTPPLRFTAPTNGSTISSPFTVTISNGTPNTACQVFLNGFNLGNVMLDGSGSFTAAGNNLPAGNWTLQAVQGSATATTSFTVS